MQAKSSSTLEMENNRQYAREVLVVLFINTLICSLVAVFIWIAVPSIGVHGLINSWVYSQCIGQSICIGNLLFSHRLRKSQVKSKLIYLLCIPAIVLAGFFFGDTMAAFIMSNPAITSDDDSFFWISLLVTIFVSLFSIIFYGTWHHVTTLKMAAIKESARASQAKLAMLQAQVEPHMLFNTLSNLRSLIDSNPQAAQSMLDHLVDFLRATLVGSRHETASLKEEFSLTENYLSLMEIRMGDRLSFDLELPQKIEAISVPVLILQPVVENAIKHGLEPTVERGHISVHARMHDEFIAVEISDTGVGYRAVDQTLSSGFGLQSVSERLQTDNIDYDVLSIVSPPVGSERGTSITIRFPLPSQLLSQSSSK